MSPFDNPGLSSTSSSVTLTVGSNGLYRRPSVTSPGALSDGGPEDFFGLNGFSNGSFSDGGAASPSLADGSSPRLGHGRRSSAASSEAIEVLTRKMMALGLKREEAEAAAQRHGAGLMAVAVSDEDFGGECSALGEMVKNGKVSMDDAIARVAAIARGECAASDAGLGAVGTPLDTVKEEEEPKFEIKQEDEERGRSQGKGHGRSTAPKKIVGFGGAGAEEDNDDFV